VIQRPQGIAAAVLCAVLWLAGCSGSGAPPAPQQPSLAASGEDESGPYRGLEVFTVGEADVAAYRYERVAGPRGRLYAFCVRPAAAPAYVIALGSYDDTTRIAREMIAIAPDARIYHLDRYDAAGASTLALFEQPPAYEAVRALVSEAVAGRPVETATQVPLGVALAHAMVTLTAFPAASQTGGPCAP
jgi:hypothetical protein